MDTLGRGVVLRLNAAAAVQTAEPVDDLSPAWTRGRFRSSPVLIPDKLRNVFCSAARYAIVAAMERD